LRHHEDGAVLHVGGRLWDREETSFQLRRANQRWELVGPFNALTQVQQDTLYAIRQAGGMSPTDGAKCWGISKQAAQKRFDQLVQHGVAVCSKGIYTSI
jgi:DNA-binding MarR family transcriptional regulator